MTFMFLCVTHWLVLGLGIFAGVFLAGAIQNAPIIDEIPRGKSRNKLREIDLSRSEWSRV